MKGAPVPVVGAGCWRLEEYLSWSINNMFVMSLYGMFYLFSQRTYYARKDKDKDKNKMKNKDKNKTKPE